MGGREKNTFRVFSPDSVPLVQNRSRRESGIGKTRCGVRGVGSEFSKIGGWAILSLDEGAGVCDYLASERLRLNCWRAALYTSATTRRHEERGL